MFAKAKASVIWQAGWRHRTYTDTRAHTRVRAPVFGPYNEHEISALSSTKLISVHISVWQQLSDLVLENVKLLPVVKLQPIISLQLAGWSAATVSCGKKSSLLFRRSFLSHTLLMLENPKTLCYRPVSFLLMSSCRTTAPAPQHNPLWHPADIRGRVVAQ